MSNYLKILTFFFLALVQQIVVYSQSIKNEESPQSVNVQGNNNEINYNVMLINERLLDFFLDNKPAEHIEDLINSLKTDSISEDLMKDYAKGVLNIYESLYSNSRLIINDTIKSSFNGKTHVFDIGVHTEALGHDITLVYKLLPISHKADIIDIIHFLNALKDIKVAKGIIICNGGFSEAVKEYANKNSIDLCTFKDAESKNWNKDVEIPVIWIKSTPLFHIDFGIHLKQGDKLLRNPSENLFSYNDGLESFTILDVMTYKWENNLIPHVTDSIKLISMKTSALKMNTFNKEWSKVSKLDIYYTTREEYYLKFFTPDKFKAIENIITNEIQFTEITMEFDVFEENDNWVKIGEDIKEDNSPGEINEIPKGLVLFVTASIDDLSEAEMKGDITGLKKIE